MKKLICVMLCMAIFFGVLTPVAYAANGKDNREEIFRSSVSFSCSYNADSDQIVIDGSVSHDVMIKYDKYIIHVIAVAPEAINDNSFMAYSEEDILSESSMTIRFTLYIDVNSPIDRYSGYVVVLESPDGERFAAGDPKIATVSSDFSYDPDSKAGYKGILTTSSSAISSAGAGTVIVDFNISEGLGDSSDGYMHPMGSAYLYIKKSYIEKIDRRMIAASLTEAKTYIRFMLKTDNAGKMESVSGGTYGTPNVYSEDVLNKIIALTEFLTERYNGEYGDLFGFILGTRVDEECNLLTKKTAAESFADLYTLYLVAVSNAARVIDSSLDIVIPISDSISALSKDGIIEMLMRCLDNDLSGKLRFSLMVETDDIMAVLSDELNEVRINADSIERALSRLSSSIGISPVHLMYKWKPAGTVSGAEICGKYIYAYMKLLDNDDVSSFVLDISDDKVKYSTVKKVFESIDTGADEDYINGFAEIMGATSWDELIGDSVELPVLRTLINKSFLNANPIDAVGEFIYMDFSSSSLRSLMTKGENCALMTTTYDTEGERLLKVGSQQMKVGDSFELIGRFEYPESYYYTPVMSLDIELEDMDASEYALYEICLTFGNNDTRIEINDTVKAGEKMTLYFDVSEFAEQEYTNFFKISARCLTEDTTGITLLLRNVRGYSSEYNSEELGTLIEEFRAGIRALESDKKSEINKTAIVAIAVSIIAVGVGLVIVFRRDDEKDESVEEEETE